MRTTSLVATGLAAAFVSAQSSPAPADGFEYVGCVKADVAAFPVAVDFFAPFTAAECQEACGRFGYAALDGGCNCGPLVPKPSYEVVDDSACSRACIEGDASAGTCGGSGVSSLYRKQDGDEDSESSAGTETPTAGTTAEPTTEPTTVAPTGTGATTTMMTTSKADGGNGTAVVTGSPSPTTTPEPPVATAGAAKAVVGVVAAVAGFAAALL